jgi:gluconokinase
VQGIIRCTDKKIKLQQKRYFTKIICSFVGKKDTSMIVLALEASTSAAKALLFDCESGVISSAQERYGMEIDDGQGRTDTHGVFEAVCRLGKKIAEGKPVAAIAISSTWHSLSVCDESLTPQTVTYSWNFPDTAGYCRRMRENKALTWQFYSRTGCIPHPTFPRHVLQLLRDHGINLSDKRCITQGGYIYHQLTGEFCESRSTQSGTGFLNLHTLDYDSFTLDYFDVRPEQLGRLVDYQTTASLNRHGADLLGLDAGIPVVPAHPDGALNQVGNYANRDGIMTLSVGTSGALRMVTEKPILPEGHPLWCYAGVNSLISGAATSGAGNIIDWFFDRFTQGRFEFADFEEPIDPWMTYPTFLPFLFGERCPGWQEDRLTGLFNLSPAHTIREMYAAVQMGILFNLYQCYEILREHHREPEEIILSGGITHSERWTQMLADLWGRDILVADNPNASLLGATALALHAAGALEDINQFDIEFKNAQKVSPNPDMKSFYQGNYEDYLQYYNLDR